MQLAIETKHNMIKSYTNKSSWDSETKSTTESTIGLLLDSNTPVVNGVNVLVTVPKVGDAVVLDENGDVKFIAKGTFVGSSFPNTWTKVGVVYNVLGKEVWIVSHTNLGGIKYSNVWRLKITGYTLDGADHTVTLNTYNNSGTATSLSWTYNASSVSDFVSQFNTWAATSGNDPNSRGYYMYVDSDNVVQFVEPNYTTYRQHSDSLSGGATSAANVATEIPAITWNLDQDGNSRVYNTVNIGAIKRWGGRTLSAAEAITVNNTPISKASFDGTYGESYRTAYGTYDNYLEHNQAKVPVNRGVLSWRNKGYEYTYALANLQYTAKDGTSAYMYQAPHSVAAFGYSANADLAAGKWYIPDVEEMVILMRPITVGNTGVSSVSQYDDVNKTIYAMGGSTISTNANRWCSCRCDSNNVWFCNSNGYLNDYHFCFAHTILPVCRLLIP